MRESNLLLNEIKEEQLETINGGDYGSSLIWNEIISLNPWGSCSWPGGFYSNPTPGSGSTCTNH